MGIGNEDHVVLAPAGWDATNIGIATRIYWTFKVLGHDQVSILDSGMNAYLADKKNPLQKGMTTPQSKIFKARFRPQLLATTEEISHKHAPSVKEGHPHAPGAKPHKD